ncbi:LysR family transcriptional regulator [Nakamurella sp.]|uniref:LysR family transcriptional regulator n=1 Tax=Nakamurella sp. TaxID=1869182 RepID=UPI003784AFDF
MDLRSLEYFVAVAEELSFTRAAQRCDVTQPTISGQVQALEREVGESLFDRSSRGIALTDGGRTLLPYARRCLAAVEDAKAEFSARAGLLRGALHIGTGGGIEHTTVPTLLGRMRHRHPGIEVHVTEATSAPLVEMVLQGRLNAAVIARPAEPLPAAITASTMFSDRLVAVFDPAVVELAGDPVPLQALTGESIISYPRTSALRSRLEDVAAGIGVAVTVNYVANDVRLQVAFAREGVGVAICAGSDPALADLAGLTVRPISPPVDFDKILIWRHDITPCAPLRAFLQLWWDFRARDERVEKTA